MESAASEGKVLDRVHPEYPLQRVHVGKRIFIRSKHRLQLAITGTSLGYDRYSGNAMQPLRTKSSIACLQEAAIFAKDKLEHFAGVVI